MPSYLNVYDGIFYYDPSGVGVVAGFEAKRLKMNHLFQSNSKPKIYTRLLCSNGSSLQYDFEGFEVIFKRQVDFRLTV